DVGTQRSLTLLMIDCFLKLYPAIEQFILNHPKLLDMILISATDLEVLNDTWKYLFVFHSIQELTPTGKTLILSIILPLYEGLIEMLRLMKITLPNISHIIDVSLQKLCEYVDKARGTRIYALAMG
ncbi:hypothetical protein EV368DRAFT_20144, partial [Lentinula lateritia]